MNVYETFHYQSEWKSGNAESGTEWTQNLLDLSAVIMNTKQESYGCHLSRFHTAIGPDFIVFYRPHRFFLIRS